MNVRLTLGDVGLAVLLALPTATLANPSAIIWQSQPALSSSQVAYASADRPVLPSRFDFPG